MSNALLICIAMMAAAFVYVPQSKGQAESETDIVFGTKGVMASNGRMWISLNKQSKIMLLLGVYEGATLVRKEISSEKSDTDAQRILDGLSIAGFHYSDIAKQVDMFYADSANLRIPIIEAYKRALSKMKGASTSELERSATDLRKAYNQ